MSARETPVEPMFQPTADDDRSGGGSLCVRVCAFFLSVVPSVSCDGAFEQSTDASATLFIFEKRIVRKLVPGIIQ